MVTFQSNQGISMIESAIYPNAQADLAKLKSQLRTQNNISLPGKEYWHKAEAQLVQLTNQPDRFLKLLPEEFEKFCEYLDGFIQFDKEISGNDFVNGFENCFKGSDLQGQLGLLQFFYDQNQASLIVNNAAPIQTNKIQIKDSHYQVAHVSFMGTHTPGVNSDAYRLGNSSSPLIAAVFDGVSEESNDLKNQQYTGHAFNISLTEQIESSLPSSTEVQSSKAIAKHDISDFLNKKDFAQLKVSDLLQFIKTNQLRFSDAPFEAKLMDTIQGKPEIKNILLTDFFLMKQYGFQIDSNIGQLKVSNLFKNWNLTLKKEAAKYLDDTNSLLTDSKDFIKGLINTNNDNDDTQIPVDLDSFKTRLTRKLDQLYSKTQNESRGNATISIALDLGASLGFYYKSDSPILIIKKDGSVQARQGQMRKSDFFTIPKDDVAGFILITDGIAGNSVLKQKLEPFRQIISQLPNPNPETIIRTALNFAKDRTDDKTVIAVKVES